MNFLAGLLAGFISVTVCNPLDIARTRLNVLVVIISSRTVLPTRATAPSTRTSPTPCAPSGRRKDSGASTPVRTHSPRLSHQCRRHSAFSLHFLSYLRIHQKTAGRERVPPFQSLPGGHCHRRFDLQRDHKSHLGRADEADGSVSAPGEQPLSEHCAAAGDEGDGEAGRWRVMQEGVQSLFKGLGASLLSVSNAIVYFFCY